MKYITMNFVIYDLYRSPSVVTIVKCRRLHNNGLDMQMGWGR
jgi:hypothetical protein